ncbi:Lactase-like protein [Galemys pyrenaicus]|uniref:Lactase-like protein n=1 Tax=Galemys pyrenaicus TaxID=202257 RepID=A0A8J5ZI90_GALPY|nr:Lactase-like protein [Galemys pyrenaicus]
MSMTTYFSDYTNLCFEAFGDRVKHWVTYSDPQQHRKTIQPLMDGSLEVGRKGLLRLKGDRQLCEFWLLLQAHAQAWHSCNRTWRSRQQGLVGISLNCNWEESVDTSNSKDIEAAKQYLEFCLGWFVNPIYAGDHPQATF